MTYRELRRLTFANAAAMVENADLTSLFGEGDLEERDEGRAEKAQRDVVEFLRRYTGDSASAAQE